MPKNTIFPPESAPACQFHLIETAVKLIAQNRFSQAAELAMASEQLMAGDYNENELVTDNGEGLPCLVLTRKAQ